MFRLWLPALLIMAGCGMTGPEKDEHLRDRRQRWVRLGISDYRFDFRRACFCAGPAGTLRVEVRDRDVVSVTDVETGAAPAALPENWVGTIDDVFAELQRSFDRNADRIDLEFDLTHHFPRSAFIDPARNTFDDEVYLTLSNFQRLF